MLGIVSSCHVTRSEILLIAAAPIVVDRDPPILVVSSLSGPPIKFRVSLPLKRLFTDFLTET